MKSESNHTPTHLPAALSRRSHRAAALAFVRQQDWTTQTEISAALDLSPATTMRIVDDLMAEGFVMQDGYEKSGGGRPRSRLVFVGTRHAVVGIEASLYGFKGAVTDLTGKIQTEMVLPAGTTGAENLAVLIRLISELIAFPRPQDQTIVGIGIGVPSIVRQPEGEVVLTLGLDWRNVPLKAILAEHFKMTIVVENDRNLAALGEWGFGVGQGAHSVVSLAIVPGAGAGIVIGGELVRGHSNAAGEISWFLDDPALTGRQFSRLGDKDHLRFVGFPEGLPMKLGKIADRHAAGEISIEAWASANDQDVEVSELLDFSTMAVASISAILNPEIVVLNGGIVRGGEFVLEVLRQRLAGKLYEAPRLAMTGLGSRDIVFGAIRSVLDATVLKPA